MSAVPARFPLDSAFAQLGSIGSVQTAGNTSSFAVCPMSGRVDMIIVNLTAAADAANRYEIEVNGTVVETVTSDGTESASKGYSFASVSLPQVIAGDRLRLKTLGDQVGAANAFCAIVIR